MLDLILSAVQAIMQVMVIVFVGSLLYSKGYINNDKQKWLSKLNLYFFTPCLLFSNIASVISFEKLLAFWPIPVFYVLFTSISWALCQLVLPVFGVDKYYKRFILACVMFCNTNSLPVAIISSLAVSEAGKSLYWGSDDSQDMVSARGISYTLFFGLFCNILRWSYGYNLLQKKENDDDTIVEENSSTKSNRYGSLSYSSSSRRSSSTTMSGQHNNRDIENNDTEDSSSSSSSSFSLHKKKSNETANLLSNQKKQQLSKAASTFQSFFRNINQYMSPPLYAALLALFVGLCSPIKRLMYNSDSFLYASLTKAIESCGKASVPIVLVCLGAQLKSIRETQHGSAPPKYRQPVSLSIFIRMVLVPICVLPLVYAFAKYGSKWSELANDPMFIVSMIVVGCTPTAINLAQITQVSGVFEEEMLNVLFWSYGVICIPVCTFVVFLALYMVRSMK